MTCQFQRTLAKEGSLEGLGLHSGESCKVLFKPASVDTGIQFFKNGKRIIDELFDKEDEFFSKDSLRCTSIGSGDNQIQTVEHLLAALQGLAITNVVIEVNSSEIPALDGSSLPFVKFLKELGIVDQAAQKQSYKVTEPLFCYDERLKGIAVYPADHFSISYVLDYDYPSLRDQKYEFVFSQESFEKDIAPARTFCTEEEALELQKRGLGKGASYETTLVMSKNGPIGNALRFSDECVRHKILDLLGDLYLLGYPIIGHVVALRSGHLLNRKLVNQIKKQRGSMSAVKKESKPLAVPFGIEEINTILPHRYPFLLVDKVLEMGELKAVGIKNVTTNEPFFQGHFPQKAVMPGVLIIEALAQLGGILMLSRFENRGKLAYLIGIDQARFRRVVVPGDQLRLEINIVRIKLKMGVVRCVATVDGEEACSAEIMFTLSQ